MLGGRPKAKHTIQAEALKKYLIGRVFAERKPILDALIAKAKKKDVAAINSLLDRTIGKPWQMPEEWEGNAAFIVPIMIKRSENPAAMPQLEPVPVRARVIKGDGKKSTRNKRD